MKGAVAGRSGTCTLIRNENAYSCCAAMLLATPPPQPADPPLAPLYVAGDSHALSPSWRVVRWRGQPRVLAPVLVTGLKLWHLRDGADFFPKANFEAAAASLPDGADVVFAFGVRFRVSVGIAQRGDELVPCVAT